MAETLSSLMEKLIDARLKGFFVQDKVHRARDAGEGLDPETTEQLVELNERRVRVANEIDELFADAVETGRALRSPVVKIMDMGQGKS